MLKYQWCTLCVGVFILCSCTNFVAAQSLESKGGPEQLDLNITTPQDADLHNNWHTFTGTLVENDATFWFRQKIIIAPDTNHNPIPLSVSVSGVYDAFWDGLPIGSNRHYGIRTPQNSRLFIPLQLLEPGEHTLHFRISGLGLKRGDNVNLNIHPSVLRTEFFGVHYSVIIVFFVTTAAYIAGIFFLVSGLRHIDRITLFSAAIICFVTGTIAYMSEARYLTPYPYLWEPIINAALAVLTIAFTFTLPIYVAARLKVLHAVRFGLGLIITLPLSFIEIASLDQDTRLFLWLSLYLLLICAAYGRQKKNDSAILGIGILASTAALLLDPDQKHLFIIVITLLFATELGFELRRRFMEANQLALTSERLRTDLIKRNIQPHFLMNSLTALMEWIETSPDDAISYVDGLAQEFRMLSDFAERSTVSLKEELVLCNIHLQLMSRRLNARLSLQENNLNTHQNIPPAVFHTLVENALSHNDYSGKDISFTLTEQAIDSGVQFTLTTPIISSQNSPQSTGLGTRYIKARLKELYGKAFRFHSEQVGSNWVSTISINER